MILSLHSGRMILDNIQGHLLFTIGKIVSHETISEMLGQDNKEALTWRQRPLESLYPVIYLDAIAVEARDGWRVRDMAVHQSRPGAYRVRPGH